jgi:hypothetical protein
MFVVREHHRPQASDVAPGVTLRVEQIVQLRSDAVQRNVASLVRDGVEKNHFLSLLTSSIFSLNCVKLRIHAIFH